MKINITLDEYKKLVNSKKEKNFFRSKMDELGFKLNDDTKELSSIRSSLNNSNKQYAVNISTRNSFVKINSDAKSGVYRQMKSTSAYNRKDMWGVA